MSDKCEPTAEFLNTHCEKSFSLGEKAHADGIVRSEAVKWALKERLIIFCASCVVAGWNFAAGDEPE